MSEVSPMQSHGAGKLQPTRPCRTATTIANELASRETTTMKGLTRRKFLPTFMALGLGTALGSPGRVFGAGGPVKVRLGPLDRKSTRLNSSHQLSSYAVFCLKK